MGLFSGILGSVSKGLSSFLGGGDLLRGILGGVSARSKSKGEEKLMKLKGEQDLANIRETGLESRRSSEFETMLAKWLKDSEKEERRKGLSNYARYSTVGFENPSYVPPAVGAMPSASLFQAARQNPPAGTPTTLLPTDPNRPPMGGR